MLSAPTISDPAVGAVAPAFAEFATTLLACKGTTTAWPSAIQGKATPQPFSLGLLVDFTKRTVTGFPFPVMDITEVTELMIFFRKSVGISIVDGSIDRVTGDAEGHHATYKSTKSEDMLRPGNTLGGYNFSLKCAPAQRMF